MRRTLGDRVYACLLMAYPPHVRAVAGDEMTRQFRAERAARRRQPVGVPVLWVRAAADVIWHGVLERLAVPTSVSTASRGTLMRTASEPPTRPGPFDGVLKDATWGLRRLRANPGFTVVAALTLALGIGATSAIFSVVNGVLLRPLAFPDATRVVGLFQVWEGKRAVFAPPNFIDVEARAKTFVSAAAYGGNDRTLTGAGDPMRLLDVDVTSGFFNVLETPPLVGRTLTRADNEPGHTHVMVLSFRLWQSRFGGDRGIVQRDVTIDGEPWRVVGVMPASFDWPLGADSWTPAEYTPSFVRENRGAWYLNAMARLEPNVTTQQAAAEMADLGRQLERQYPDMDGKVGMTA
ncbi:MAG TPA: ABC transporter permease, partial [Vicinamibacterales bacterium]